MSRMYEKDEKGNIKINGIEFDKLFGRGGAVTKEAKWRLLEALLVLKCYEDGEDAQWRLPEEEFPSQHVLVMVQIQGKDGDIRLDNVIRQGIYQPGEGWVILGYPDFVGKVIAWRRLPNKYRREIHVKD